MSDALNETEQLVMLALARLGEDAYGVPVRQEIENRAGRPISIAAVYAALGRLERRGLVASWTSEPSPHRGGRAKKHFEVTSEGARALDEARRAMDRMWDGVELEGLS